MKTQKNLPYGISDFRSLIKNDFYYCDRTSYIQNLERNNNYLFFLRPRRFGKSLFLSMLNYYYGKQYEDEFESLFSGLFIGKPENTTKDKNGYFVLRFDFSGINTGNASDVMAEFNKKIQNGIKIFNNDYGLLNKTELKEVFKNIYPSSTFGDYITEVLPKLDRKVMVLIDEYDHFTNEILSLDFISFSDVVSQNGFVRKFYESVKYFTGIGLIERFFATGVTPVTLDSMTSGFNIAVNISLDREFNEIAGFTAPEVKKMVEDLFPDISTKERDVILADASSWFNGSMFSPDAEVHLYNPAMLLRFLSKINRTNLKYPREMVDNNIVSYFSKIKNIVKPGDEERNLNVIDSILKTGYCSSGLTQIFTFERSFTQQDFVTLLYYYGLLTIKDTKDFDLLFEIPNYVIKGVYWDFFTDVLKMTTSVNVDLAEIKNAVRSMGEKNEILPMVKIVENILATLSNSDFMKFDEKYVKLLFIVYISLTRSYKIKSEPEVGQKYPDLMFLDSQNYIPKHQQLFEIKYLKKEDAGQLEEVKKSAVKQVDSYMKLEEIKELSNLRFWIIIFTAGICSWVSEVTEKELH